jgi:hypothetical protein
VLLASPDHLFYYWWDPATGVESRGPTLPRGKFRPADVAMSPDGRWILFATGNNGQEVWRGRTDGKKAAELLYTLPGDRNTRAAAIDDDGRPVLAVYSWYGEIYLVRPEAGSRF